MFLIRISPYSSYPYIVYITLPCIVRLSLVFVVFKQLLKHLWLFLAVVQLQSCIGIYIQRDVHAYNGCDVEASDGSRKIIMVAELFNLKW